MIATLNVEDVYLDESISTCRFARRVAMIENVAVVNEEIDPTLVIRQLKQQIKVRMLHGQFFIQSCLVFAFISIKDGWGWGWFVFFFFWSVDACVK